MHSVAYHYKSERTLRGSDSLLESLEGLSVYHVKEIVTKRTLDTHTVPDVGHILLEESNDQLRLFVPFDKSKLKIGLAYYLPNKMTEFLKLSDRHTQIVSVILHASNQTLDEVLDLEGIISRVAIEGINGSVHGTTEDDQSINSEASSSIAEHRCISSDEGSSSDEIENSLARLELLQIDRHLRFQKYLQGNPLSSILQILPLNERQAVVKTVLQTEISKSKLQLQLQKYRLNLR